MKDTKKPDLVKRIHMVQGQLEAIVRMMEEGDDCGNVLTQLKAARAGFERVFSLFLGENLRRCMGAHTLPPKAREELDLITDALTK